MKKTRVAGILFLGAMCWTNMLNAQVIDQTVSRRITGFLDSLASCQTSIGRIHIDSVTTNQKKLNIYLTDNGAYVPWREDNVKETYAAVRQMLPEDLRKKQVAIFSDGLAIEDIVPLACREKGNKHVKTFVTPDVTPLVANSSTPFVPERGLQGRHIGMWQSHGYYYEAKLDRWEWQRARIFQTVEDLYTQSYVLPFLVPMLENAGAYVMMPRERDVNPIELIMDNDGAQAVAQGYSEQNGESPWSDGAGVGFAYKRAVYINHENPFREGTYRQSVTIKKGNGSKAVWTPTIDEEREYAVYVAYKTLPESADDAAYTVVHKGVRTEFRVNQQMGGGTWIYLGTFNFGKGHSKDNCVELSNLSRKAGRIVTADGVKLGGGMGNVARYIDPAANPDTFNPIVAEDAQTSGYPRFCEGARYWMQWAGVPDSVYDLTASHNDYTDDYKNRGLWINWLSGGSAVNPTEGGLNIPLDMSFAFHTDAGTTLNDRTIGSLVIYDSHKYDGVFANGASRALNRDLADLVQSQIVDDVRKQYEPTWNRRGIWDKSYFEAWMPKVPAMLLELLSHQNFADMRYGLDPRFRFTVSRAIYKGMLRFIASQRGEKYVVQPLPVSNMVLTRVGNDEVELRWRPTADSLEPTAVANRYLVFTRTGEGDWDNGQLVKKTEFRTRLVPGEVCSYKVVAVNDGGKSFPSEILSAGIAQGDTGKPVLVVNGFNRVAAPADFVAPEPSDTALAGFLDEQDHGVPYLKDISYIGSMKEFRRKVPWMDDDASGFGDSYGNYETQEVAGNTFDYPAVHGAALLAAGRSFVSCSDEAVEDSMLLLTDYDVVDLILGKECQTKMGRGGIVPLAYKTFSPMMEKKITEYLKNGRSLFVSGQFVASDLWDNPVAPSQKEDKDFAQNVLKYKWRVGRAATGGGLKWVKSAYGRLSGKVDYHNELNKDCYVVESPDAIEPACKEAATVMRYAENNLSAAVAYRGEYNTFVMGVPFETLKTSAERASLMKTVLNLLKADAQKKD